jgi:hypothetical protein
LAQVRVAELGKSVAGGGVVLLNTVAVANAVQPLAAVKVTEYVPAVETEMVELVAPVDHTTVPTPIAARLVTGTVQVSVVEARLMLTAAALVALLTVAVASAVQPLAAVKVTE